MHIGASTARKDFQEFALDLYLISWGKWKELQLLIYLIANLRLQVESKDEQMLPVRT